MTSIDNLTVACARVLTISGVIYISGCAAYNTELRNASGDVSYCQNVGWGWLGTPIAIINQKRCESALRERGYVSVDAPSVQSVAKTPESAKQQNQANGVSESQASKIHTLDSIQLPESWIKLTIPDVSSKSGAILWLKRQSPDVYLAVSIVPDPGGDLTAYSKSQQQDLVKKITDPELSPISDFEYSGIKGGLMYVVGNPANGKDRVRSTSYIFRKNTALYRLEISQLEREYFSSRESVGGVVDLIIGGL